MKLKVGRHDGVVTNKIHTIGNQDKAILLMSKDVLQWRGVLSEQYRRIVIYMKNVHEEADNSRNSSMRFRVSFVKTVPH